MPPLGATRIKPSEPPLQLTSERESVLITTEAGAVSVTWSIAVHPLLSVTVTVNVPEAKPVALEVV